MARCVREDWCWISSDYKCAESDKEEVQSAVETSLDLVSREGFLEEVAFKMKFYNPPFHLLVNI